MSGRFGAMRAAAHPVNPGDRAFPVPYFDDSLIGRRTVLATIFRFDGVVDPEALRRSLSRLICLKGWSVLGARLRRKGRHQLEYLVPGSYSPERPAFLWSNVQYDTRAANHEHGMHLPRASVEPAVLTNLKQIAPLMRGPSIPTTVKEYLDHDLPQLGIHVVSFTDTTLVTISWPHTFTDAMGFGDIMQAWCLVLQNREDEVRPLHDLEHDFLQTFGLSPTEQYKDRKRIMSMLQLSLFGIRQGYQTIRHWGEEDRIICVPGPTIRKLHREALLELASRQESNIAPFLSEGDVLLAWWAKVLTRQYRSTSKRTLAVGQVFGHRPFHAKELVPLTHAHLGNVNCRVTAYLKVRDIYNLTLAEIALRVRQAIIEISSSEQLNALAAIHRQRKDRFGLELVYGDTTMHMANLSNWSKARLFDVDFSAAVKHESPGNETKKLDLQPEEKSQPASTAPLRPSFILCHHKFSYWMALRNTAFVTGKDEQGNYWLSACVQRDAWAAVEKAVAEYGAPSPEIIVGKQLPDLTFPRSELAFKWDEKDIV